MVESFSERVDAVFGGLDSKLTSVANCPLKDDPLPDKHYAADSVARHPRPQEVDYRCRRSQLNQRSMRHSQRMPDYIKNPHRWKKYDLTDDESIRKDFEEGLTEDQVNRRTALSFIADLRKRKEAEHCADYQKDSKTKPTPDQPKIIFRNPKTSRRKCGSVQFEDQAQGQADSELQLASSQSVMMSSTCTQDFGVFRMPEYVVGSKRKRMAKGAGSTGSCGTSSKAKKEMVILSHLNVDQEES